MTKIKLYRKDSDSVKEIKCPKGTLVYSLEGIKDQITEETYNHCMKKIKEVGEENLAEFRMLFTKSGLWSIFAVITKEDIQKSEKGELETWRQTVLKSSETENQVSA